MKIHFLLLLLLFKYNKLEDIDLDSITVYTEYEKLLKKYPNKEMFSNKELLNCFCEIFIGVSYNQISILWKKLINNEDLDSKSESFAVHTFKPIRKYILSKNKKIFTKNEIKEYLNKQSIKNYINEYFEKETSGYYDHFKNNKKQEL